MEVRNITFAVPMQSRHSREVVRAVQEVYIRLQTLQLPVLRLHSDLAQDFTGVKLRDWCTQRDILQTSAAGDESAGNGRCESELGIIQAQTRVHLRAAGLEADWWPLALRHTVEQRQRDQLASMGISLPPLIPFGTECFANLKRWHRRDWDHPFEKIRVLGPAMGMSTTSKGYYIQSLTTGKFMRSTVVVNPPELPPVLPQLPQPDGDDYSPSYMPEGEEDDHLQDVEEPMEICPHGAAEQLHPFQGGASKNWCRHPGSSNLLMAPNHAGLGANNMWIYYLQRFPSCCGPQQGGMQWTWCLQAHLQVQARQPLPRLPASNLRSKSTSSISSRCVSWSTRR